MASPQSPFGSPEEISLNQAILESLRHTARDLPPTTWNNQTQFIPVQTTTTCVPQTKVRVPTVSRPQVPLPQNTTVRVPTVQQQTVRVPTVQQQTVRVPTIQQPVPILPSPFTALQPTQPVPFRISSVTQPIVTTNLPPIPKTQIPIIPPLATTTTTRKTGFNLPASPRTTFQPLQTVQLSPRGQISPRSPGRMSPDEEDRLRIAIMASLQEANLPATTIPTIIRTPPRSPLFTPPDLDEEGALLQEAIQASLLAATQANLATFHANQVVAAPVSPKPLSPNTLRILEDRALREEQDRAYQEALRIDTEKAENAKKAAEAAAKAAAAAAEAARKLQEAKIAEEARKEALQPPILKYPVEEVDKRYVYLIKFRLPSGSAVNHSFHRDEPFSSVIQQLRFDLKYLGDLSFLISPGKIITCDPNTPISECGFGDKVLVTVSLAD